MRWTNPHVSLTVTLANGTDYRIDWNSIRRLAKVDVFADSLKPGDHVVIIGRRHRNREKRVMALLREVCRLSDGWT